jgi:hypothetical protein
MKHYVYKITNLVNNKIYIGKHSTNNINDGYMGSGKLIKHAIEKYGVDKFKKEIMFEFETEEEALLMESEIVDSVFVSRLDTYNIAEGGRGSNSHIGKDLLSIGGKNAYSLGKLNEGKLKFIESLKSDAELSNAWKKKISTGLKLQWELNGHNWIGKSHSEKTKLKMSESHKGKHEGVKNSQYGTCWIHNLELKESKRIKKEELYDYISVGWIKGRKMKF